jgi:hypothetical protein
LRVTVDAHSGESDVNKEKYAELFGLCPRAPFSMTRVQSHADQIDGELVSSNPPLAGKINARRKGAEDKQNVGGKRIANDWRRVFRAIID